MRLAALVLVALALTACESNQERSAELEKLAKRHKRETAKQEALAQRALSITEQSAKVRVIATAVVRSSEGAAAIITLRNQSSTTLSDVPIQIDVIDAQGASVYRNNTPGTSTTLISAALLPAHATITWIDDQVSATGIPASVTAEVGEGTPVTGAIPQVSVQGTHLSEGAQAEGDVVNHSGVSQQELVVDAVARKAGRIVAAGRAVLPAAPPGASTPFELYFVGDPSGARLEVSAPVTTPG
ncbi:MAG TPA: hypothetical protein VK778_00070 [Solirubrobacteraceae bacterium]|nr:hypothetical protein [Solirubrobacteraceae bacterium]